VRGTLKIPKKRKESDHSMNKKMLALLILPLMVLPLASFGYAHLYDSVTKKYKLYVGTMYANITGFHVDNLRLIDKDNDGVLFGDELVIDIFEDADGVFNVRILVNPVSPNFILDTTMNITNVGDLPWTVTWTLPPIIGPMWDNGTTDPCWLTPPTKSLAPPESPMWPSELWSWEISYWKINSTGRYPATSTEHVYKPGNIFQVVQHIDLKQPTNAVEQALYRDIMGKWFWIWESFAFESEDPITTSSWTWPPPIA